MWRIRHPGSVERGVEVIGLDRHLSSQPAGRPDRLRKPRARKHLRCGAFLPCWHAPTMSEFAAKTGHASPPSPAQLGKDDRWWPGWLKELVEEGPLEIVRIVRRLTHKAQAGLDGPARRIPDRRCLHPRSSRLRFKKRGTGRGDPLGPAWISIVFENANANFGVSNQLFLFGAIGRAVLVRPLAESTIHPVNVLATSSVAVAPERG